MWKDEKCERKKDRQKEKNLTQIQTPCSRFVCGSPCLSVFDAYGIDHYQFLYGVFGDFGKLRQDICHQRQRR
jgi:hypothetical protein